MMVKMNSSTFKIIRDFCLKFKIPADIEFTCYDAYKTYFQRYYDELNKKYKRITAQQSSSISNPIDYILNEIEDTTLLHILTLILIVGKFILGPKAGNLFTHVQDYLNRNGTPINRTRLLNTEYTVFRHLRFNVSLPVGVFFLRTFLFSIKKTQNNNNCVFFDIFHNYSDKNIKNV